MYLASETKYFNEGEKVSTEPDSNQRPKDFMVVLTLQSSALPTELSVGRWFPRANMLLVKHL